MHTNCIKEWKSFRIIANPAAALSGELAAGQSQRTRCRWIEIKLKKEWDRDGFLCGHHFISFVKSSYANASQAISFSVGNRLASYIPLLALGTASFSRSWARWKLKWAYPLPKKRTNKENEGHYEFFTLHAVSFFRILYKIFSSDFSGKFWVGPLEPGAEIEPKNGQQLMCLFI